MTIKTCRHCDIRFNRDDAAPIPHDRCERCHEEIEAMGPLDRLVREGMELAAAKWERGDMDASPTNDAVNHPSHYTQGGIECIDALEAATVGKRGIEAICTANVIKYLWRYERKNGVEDVRKARWYLERLIKELEQ